MFDYEYIFRKNRFLAELEEDQSYMNFEKLYDERGNTFTRINKKSPGTYSEYEFAEYKNNYIRNRFYKRLFSKK